MPVYRNADYQTRVWPSLQRPDGRTLELEPGETVELELPEDFTDTHLLAGKARPTRPKRTDDATAEVADSDDQNDDSTTEQDGDGAATVDQGDAGSSDVAAETEQES